MSKILTREAFENAIRVNGAIGGSTNAVIHLLAIAGRSASTSRSTTGTGSARDVPCLVNLMPSGEYLMEDFYYAGGLPAVMRELASRPAASRRAHGQRQDDLARTSRTRRAATAR